MSFPELLKDAQRVNTILMEDSAGKNWTVQNTAMISNNIFLQLIKAHVLHPNERIDFSTAEAENTNIIQQLADQDIPADEAAILSNTIWVKYINKLRAPGEPKLIVSSLPKLSIFKF